MTHTPDPRYVALATTCLQRHPPPPGYVLPILTREGEGRAMATGPVPFDLLISDFQARLVIVDFTPAGIAAQMHKLAAQGLVQADHKQLGRELLTLIETDLMLRDWEEFRPHDDEAVAIWTHLGRTAPRYATTGMGLARADIARALMEPAND